jgi:ADP-ribose pyrophosphatase YjhB (NUDIX family)
VTDLSRFPRPNVAVDVAVLTVQPSPDPRRTPGNLAVLVQDRIDEPAGRALPGRFLRKNESLQESIRKTLHQKADLDVATARPQLLRVFDDPDRDPRAWTLSLAHYLVLPPEQLQRARGTLVPIDHDGWLVDHERLLFDHDVIVREAATTLRARYELDPDPEQILGRSFTLADLKQVHEAVLGEMVQRDTFRRRMAPRLTPDVDKDGKQATRIDGGRPARLWVGSSDEPTEDAIRRLRLPRATST